MYPAPDFDTQYLHILYRKVHSNEPLPYSKPEFIKWLVAQLKANPKCKYCGHVLCRLSLSIDHIHPVFRGGSSRFSNLQVICTRCNGRKSTKSEMVFRKQMEAEAIFKRLNRNTLILPK